jgi:hypothetical protein
MFNYYTAEKKKKEQLEMDKKKKNEDKIKEKRKKNIEVLSAGYDSRLKNFIYNMASEPIIIKDSLVHIETTRKQLYDEEVDKIRDRHGFILKGFKTEKQRIEEYLNEKKYGYIANNREKKFIKMLSTSSPNESNILPTIKEENTILIQPSMRFKPRTDLERIFDINNDYNYGRVDRRIIDKHLNAMGLYVGRRIKTESSMIEEEMNNIYDPELSINKQIEKNRNVELEKMKKKREQIIKERKEAIQIRENRYRLDQIPLKHLLIDSKNIMGDLHHKTFFKGAANFTLAPDKKLEEVVSKRNMRNHSVDTIFHKNESQPNLRQNNQTYRVVNNELKNEVAQLNPLLYELNINPYKKSKDEEIDSEKLSMLKELAFKKDYDVVAGERKGKKKLSFFHKIMQGNNLVKKETNVEETLLKENPVGYFKKYTENPDLVSRKPDDEKIRIGNKELNRDDIAGISKLVLSQCNYFHTKNKNNNTSLKSGTGKLMQTNGLTINEFEHKYYVTTTKSK